MTQARRLFALFLAVAFVAPALALDKNDFKNSAKVKAVFRKVVDPARQCVVEIECKPEKDKPAAVVALGTIVGPEGWILTKASELKGQIICKLRGKGQHVAKLVGVLEDYDLAMLKIDADALPCAIWNTTPSEQIFAGQWVAAAGTDEDPLAVGVVSVGRRKIPHTRGLLGITLSDQHNDPRIQEIARGGGAEKAGLKVGDQVTHINGQAMETREKLVKTVGSHRPSTNITVTFKRDGKEQTVTATLQGQQAPFQDRMGQQLSSISAGFPAALQHDTVLRPNQCGGPLVGLDGKVLGINIARAGRVVSYAVPSDVVMTMLDDLKSGKLAPREVVVQSSRQPVEATPPRPTPAGSESSSAPANPGTASSRK
jgi:serine protease Do